jgi:4-amino-4-deoxy-L-arabinose transferase-like glycosyltransferase
MKRLSLDTALGLLALLTFAATRLIGLAEYPIYFFTDEAANSVLAAEFLANGFHDQFGQLFPTYFQNGPSLSLSTSVYAQLLPQVVFGQSVFVTRAVPAIITLTGALAVGLIFKHIFKSRWWWTSILLLALTPAWFLHSRTAFEHPLWVSFFAWFLYFYLRYRTDQPRHLITAILFGALSFYSYNGGQLGLAVLALLLIVVDWRYHRQHRRMAVIGLTIATLCALPYLRFQLDHGGEVSAHLQLLDSYWVQDLPLSEKLSRLANEYLYGLRPDYWYAPDNSRDLIRHQMKGYGNLPWLTLPFAILGLIITVKNALRRKHPSTTRQAHAARERNAVESKNARRSSHAVSAKRRRPAAPLTPCPRSGGALGGMQRSRPSIAWC